ncbi:hypothetical protein CEJ83_20905, partial [Acinetobacter baumannii]
LDYLNVTCPLCRTPLIPEFEDDPARVRLYAIKQPETSQYLQQNFGFLNKPSKGLEIELTHRRRVINTTLQPMH